MYNVSNSNVQSTFIQSEDVLANNVTAYCVVRNRMKLNLLYVFVSPLLPSGYRILARSLVHSLLLPTLSSVFFFFFLAQLSRSRLYPGSMTECNNQRCFHNIGPQSNAIFITTLTLTTSLRCTWLVMLRAQ